MQGCSFANAKPSHGPRTAVRLHSIRRRVRRAALLDFDGHARLVLHHKLAAHRQYLRRR